MATRPITVAGEEVSVTTKPTPGCLYRMVPDAQGSAIATHALRCPARAAAKEVAVGELGDASV